MGERELKVSLQKAFFALKQVLNDWTSTNSLCQPVIDSLANLLEQYECCSGLSEKDVPFNHEFPDLRQNVQFKILSDIEDKHKILQTYLDKFQECYSKMSQHYHNVMKIYKSYAATDLNIDNVTKTSVLYPTLAKMLEWLNNVERILYQNYQCKKLIVDGLVTSKRITSENLVTLWTSENNEMTSEIKDYLCHLSFFLEEKI